MAVFDKNIKLLRRRKGRTQEEAAHTLGMKRSTLSGYENAIAEPGLKTLIAFSEYYQVAADSLIKVDLTSLSESQLSQLERGYDVYIKGSKMRVLATTIDSDNKDNIELVPEKAKAGYQRGFADPEYISALPVFKLPFLSQDKKYRTFQINGDSMLPIPDGAWVTGEYLMDWSQIKKDELCIILTIEQGIVFKQVVNQLKEKQKLILSSLNPLYEPYEIGIEEIKEIWKFKHFISNEIPHPEVPRENLTQTVASLKQDVEKLKKYLSEKK